jgi:predicted aldo/keto reductase-like oxidoreductase
MAEATKKKDSRSSSSRRAFLRNAGLISAGALLDKGSLAMPRRPSAPPQLSGGVGRPLEPRTLGRTGLKVAPIGLGTIPLFRAPREQAIDVVRKCEELGINYIDLARGYRHGLAEEWVGEAIKGRRNKFVIVTKSTDYTAKIADSVEASLKALQTDYIDVYCFHSLMQDEQWKTVIGPNGAMEALKRAQKAGKIRFIGISGHRSDQFTEIIKGGDIDLAIMIFNYVFDDALDDLLPTAKKLNVGVAGIKPFAGCFLNQHELSLRWILEQPIDVTVPGMWQTEEVVANARLLREYTPLVASEREYLAEEKKFWYYRICRVCYQCKACPQGVPYVSIFMLPLMLRRNGFYLTLDENKGKFKYLNELDKVDKCTDCGLCVETCKYHMPVPDIIRDVKRSYYDVIKLYKV